MKIIKEKSFILIFFCFESPLFDVFNDASQIINHLIDFLYLKFYSYIAFVPLKIIIDFKDTLNIY